MIAAQQQQQVHAPPQQYYQPQQAVQQTQEEKENKWLWLTELEGLKKFFDWLFYFLSVAGEPLLSLSAVYLLIQAAVHSLYNEAVFSAASSVLLGMPDMILPGAFIQSSKLKADGHRLAGLLSFICWTFLILAIITVIEVYLFPHPTVGKDGKLEYANAAIPVIQAFINSVRVALSICYCLLVRMIHHEEKQAKKAKKQQEKDHVVNLSKKDAEIRQHLQTIDQLRSQQRHNQEEMEALKKSNASINNQLLEVSQKLVEATSISKPEPVPYDELQAMFRTTLEEMRMVPEPVLMEKIQEPLTITEPLSAPVLEPVQAPVENRFPKPKKSGSENRLSQGKVTTKTPQRTGSQKGEKSPEERLEDARNHLLRTGSKVSVNALFKLAQVHKRTASEWLKAEGQNRFSDARESGSEGDVSTGSEHVENQYREPVLDTGSDDDENHFENHLESGSQSTTEPSNDGQQHEVRTGSDDDDIDSSTGSENHNDEQPGTGSETEVV